MTELQGLQGLATKFAQLSSGCQKRFKVVGKLTLDDMIKLVTPPKNPLLLDLGGNWYFVTGPWSLDRTSQNGSCVETASYVRTQMYTKNEQLLDNPTTRPNMTLRLHLFVTDTKASELTWGIYGSGFLVKSSLEKGENISDFDLPAKLNVTGAGNPLEFHSKGGTTTVDIPRSYIEIIVGGGN